MAYKDCIPKKLTTIALIISAGCASEHLKDTGPQDVAVEAHLFGKFPGVVLSTFEKCLGKEGISIESRNQGNIKGTFEIGLEAKEVTVRNSSATFKVPRVVSFSFDSATLKPKEILEAKFCVQKAFVELNDSMDSIPQDTLFTSAVRRYNKLYPDPLKKVRGQFFPYEDVTATLESGKTEDFFVNVERTNNSSTGVNDLKEFYYPKDMTPSHWWSYEKEFTNAWKIPLTWTEKKGE